MLQIRCPWCGPRDECEFHYGGEHGIKRPEDTLNTDDETWANYLFMRQNPKGYHMEDWVHIAGCRQWFIVYRNTINNNIAFTRDYHEAPEPALTSNAHTTKKEVDCEPN